MSKRKPSRAKSGSGPHQPVGGASIPAGGADIPVCPPLPPEGLVPPLPQPAEFSGKVAVVTGGTDGLGKHLCRTLVSLGAEVFFCGRRAELGHALEREWGARAHFVRCDLASVAEPAQFVRRAGEFRGRLDYLVNNAAVDRRTDIRTATAADFEQLFNINMRAYFLVCQAAIPYLEKGEGKAVVNIGTTNCMHGWAGMSVYSASKSAIVGFTRTLARDLSGSGIRVNTLSPGWIMTERQLSDLVSDAEKRDLVATQCVKHLLTEQFITPVTLFLLSKASLGLSGQNLVADGGKFFQ